MVRLGLTEKAIDELISLGDKGLTEDSSDEDIKKVVDSLEPFAKAMQGEIMVYTVINGIRMSFVLVASTGTMNLELQYYWLKEMVNASFIFIDEFDAFYHHELSYTLCRRLFKSDNQLFLTTHDTFLLSNDLLRPDCFFILKNNNISAVCNLTDKELRFGHNLEKLYRGGTFGV